MTSSRRPLASFPVYCVKRSGSYYIVYVFRERPPMRRWATKNNPAANYQYYGNAEATTHAVKTWRVDKQRRWHRLNRSGWIAFHLGNIGAGIVSHEMTHAALYYLMHWRPQLCCRLQYSKKADETLAHVQGWLVKQFWDAYYKRFSREEPKVKKR